jgi:hypothetical protein
MKWDECKRALGEFQNAGQQPVQTEAGRYGVTRNTDTTEGGQASSREDGGGGGGGGGSDEREAKRPDAMPQIGGGLILAVLEPEPWKLELEELGRAAAGCVGHWPRSAAAMRWRVRLRR